MSEEEKKQFTLAYTKILTKIWAGDEEYKNRLLSDSAAVCAEAGLDAGGAKVNIITAIKEEGTLEDQIALWNSGKKSGSIDLYVPLTKPEDMADMDLSDEDLEAVAGGGDCCCTCTPCCCC